MTVNATVAKELFERARDDAVDDPFLLAQAEGALVSTYFSDFDPEGALPHAVAKLELAIRVGDPGLRASALMDVAWTDFLLGHGLSPELVREALTLEERSVRSHLRDADIGPRMREAMMLHLVGEFDKARPVYLSLIDRARAHGSEPELSRCLALLSEVECFAGNYQLATTYAEDAHLIAVQADDDVLRSSAIYRIAMVEAHRGRVEGARRAVREASGLLRDRGLHRRGASAWVATFLELSLGDAQAAVDASLPLAPRFKGSSVVEPMVWCVFMPDLIEALVAVGDLSEAASCLEALGCRGRSTSRPWALVTAARSRALIEAAHGRLSEALAASDEALAEDVRLSMPLEHGRNLLVQGVILRRAKRRRAARISLEQAIQVFDGLGAGLWGERARVELTRIGGRSSSGDLTPTEQQVATRAAAGETNREIAHALFMSVKTVEANLSRAYRKLDVSSRRELAGRLGPETLRGAAQRRATAAQS